MQSIRYSVDGKLTNPPRELIELILWLTLKFTQSPHSSWSTYNEKKVISEKKNVGVNVAHKGQLTFDEIVAWS